MRDLENRGGVGFPYRIVVEPLVPDFQLQVNESAGERSPGGTAAVGVTVQRKGYSGPITVTVADPPAGLTVRPGTIAAGQTVGVLSLSAAADAKFPAAPIKLVGRGARDQWAVRTARLQAGGLRPAGDLPTVRDRPSTAWSPPLPCQRP